MAKPKRVRVGIFERAHWLLAIQGARLTLEAASSRVPDPNLIAALGLIQTAEKVLALDAWRGGNPDANKTLRFGAR